MDSDDGGEKVFPFFKKRRSRRRRWSSASLEAVPHLLFHFIIDR